ncbi:transcriptional regulator of acetoin/glycerol metabolism [Sinomonas atrocyanea]|uniref:GAF domain-containing protein n=1 Tax=Sinomonas atrocyanea TaxID=37927 RepID=UPI00278AEF23|nr:GAF domain-containing protein [Sinomonas atrocyanea]MDQ0260390.1 transcriptional regulator of acetoin/glycerol metabolism [Sinomonas atrocyanea]
MREPGVQGKEASPMPEQDPRPPATSLAPHGAEVPASRRLLASWQRSEHYGVSPESIDPVWTGQVVSDSLFFECGHEVLTDLHATLAGEPVSLMLTDADGLVLNRFSSDASLLRALDAVHLAPGFAFSEREAGTTGLGLALADRTPSLVRAAEHYNASLATYTCAAVPVLDPVTGRLEGSVNITTWSQQSHGLLLALAQSAASSTAALMLARSRGRTPRSQPRGGVFRIQGSRLEPAPETLRAMSPAWADVAATAAGALAAGHAVAALGERGSGRATLLAQALRQAHPGTRILTVDVPAPAEVEAWLALWGPELAKAGTAVVLENAGMLPAWAAHEVQERIVHAGSPAPGGGPLWAVTAEQLADLPAPIAALVGALVQLSPLRERPGDVLPIARHAAREARLREVSFTRAAERALTAYEWPGNADELVRAVRSAASRAETIDLQHLPPEVLSRPPAHLTRLEALERDEIIRSLSRPGATVAGAATEIGISRATIYRRMARLGISMPTAPRPGSGPAGE